MTSVTSLGHSVKRTFTSLTVQMLSTLFFQLSSLDESFLKPLLLQNYWLLTLEMILSGIQFHSKKSWTETKPEWKVLEQKQRILHLHKSFSCVQMEQKKVVTWSQWWINFIGGKKCEKGRRSSRVPPGSSTFLDDPGWTTVLPPSPVRITQLEELYPDLVFAFSREATACGVSGSSSFESYVWLVIAEDDRPPPRRDLGWCFYGFSGRLWSADMSSEITSTFLTVFPFFSKMTVNEQKQAWTGWLG